MIMDGCSYFASLIPYPEFQEIEIHDQQLPSEQVQPSYMFVSDLTFSKELCQTIRLSLDLPLGGNSKSPYLLYLINFFKNFKIILIFN